MPQNPLAEAHRALGAHFVERAGTPLAARYGDATAEHAATRAAAGVFDLTSAGKLLVRGHERMRFLMGLLTADVSRLAPGGGCHALLLTREGRVASDLRACVLEEEVLLLTPSITRSKVARILERHRAATDVEVVDVAEEHVLLAVQGPAADEVVAAALGATLPPIAPWGIATAEARDLGVVLLVRSPRTGFHGLDVLAPNQAAPALFARLVEEARARGGGPAGLEAYESLRIEAGRTAYGAEVDESTWPHEVPALLAAVDLRRGCFLGREGLERALAAPPARVLAGVRLGGRVPPVRGDRLLDGERLVGAIASACWSPSLGRPIGLALLEPAAAAPGTRLVTRDGDAAEVAALPFSAAAPAP